MVQLKSAMLSILPFATLISSSAIIRRASSTPLPPTIDPFYTPAAGFESSSPGTILRSRNVSTSLAPNSYQLLFRSTDSLGNANAAVTTVLVPNNANSSRLLSYQTAEDGAWINCAPSYNLQSGSNSSDAGILGGEVLLISEALGQGYIVNVPDYEGPQAAFTSGVQAGQATLDSIRAALASESITGVSPSAMYQMWGYSGGSLASEWAAELAPSYAPELSFTSAVLGGLIPNILQVLYTINNGSYAGLAPAGINGLGSAYPDLYDYINEHLIPSKAAEFKQSLSQCLVQDAEGFANKDIAAYFDEGIATINAPLPQKIIHETGIMGLHGTPQMPIYLYKAIGDDVSPVNDTDNLVLKYCREGTKVKYIRDAGTNHLTEAITGSQGALAYIESRFNGAAAQTDCTVTTGFNTTVITSSATGF